MTDEQEEEDVQNYGFPRNRREPSKIDFIISHSGEFKLQLYSE